jgi:hypothetical protein
LNYHWNPNEEFGDKVYNTARILVEHGQIDPMSVNVCGDSILHNFMGRLNTFKYLLHSQEQFIIDLSQTDLHGRTPLQAKARILAPNVPILLKYLLGGNSISTETAKEVWLESGEPMTLLLGSVVRLSLRCSVLDPIDAELEFMSELIRAGSDLHIGNGFGATPLDYLLNIIHCDPSDEWNKECLLLAWMSCLCRCGIDLQQYWRKEEELHENGKLVSLRAHRRNIDRMLTVYYGTTRNDVTVLVEDVCRKLDDGCDIPGSWDSEAEYAEKNKLRLIEGQSPSAFWSVTTVGFQDGDFSLERASCTTEPEN